MPRRLPHLPRIVALFATTAPSLAQVDLTTLAPPDLGPNSEFGWSLAAENGRALVGAFRDAGTGTARVYDLSTYEELHRFEPSDGLPSYFFGYSVAMSGDLAAVGAPFTNGKALDTGAVYVYDLITGAERTKLEARDGKKNDRLGWSVAIAGTKVIAGSVAGKAVYVFDVATGQQVMKLEPADGAPGGIFGWSLDTDGQRLVVGALLAVPAGSAYVFDLATGQELAKLTAPTELADDFGWDVAIDGDHVLVSAYEDDEQGVATGSVFVFDSSTGQLLGKIVAPDPTPEARFGFSLDLEGGRAVIGAVRDDELGAAYVVQIPSGQPLSKLTATGAKDLDLLGTAVAFDGGRVVAGASREDDVAQDGGGVHLFLLRTALGATYCSPGNGNSTGVPGVMHAVGDLDVTANDVELVATQLPEAQTALFIASRAQGFVPSPGGSAGNLCLGGSIARFTDGVGQTFGGWYSTAIDLTSVPEPPGFDHAILAGETWNWQCWYRDGATSNFTDAVTTTFR